ncbi:hypothetical protein JCM30760_22390 [Thiomicrorhabdus hydrogeniphila]
MQKYILIRIVMFTVDSKANRIQPVKTKTFSELGFKNTNIYKSGWHINLVHWGKGYFNEFRRV